MHPFGARIWVPDGVPDGAPDGVPDGVPDGATKGSKTDFRRLQKNLVRQKTGW